MPILLESQTCLELAKQIQAFVDEKSLTIATAESCTGGLLASIFTHFPGSSSFYMGGVSSYSNQAKIQILKVSAQTIANFGAVSEACAKEMAGGALNLFNVDFAISITGIAGPTGSSPQKPVGHICCGFASRQDLVSKVYQLSGSRLEIRSKIVAECLEDAYRLLKGFYP